MGTRSLIAILDSDEMVTSVYCHWDGYPEYNGRILHEHYKDEHKVWELLSYGSMSCLGKQIGHKHPFSDLYEGLSDSDIELYNKAREENWCRFYGRDRGEKNVSSREFMDVDQWIDSQSDAEYFYLWSNGKWLCWDYNGEVIDLDSVVNKAKANEELSAV